MNEIQVTDKVDCKIIGQVGQLFSAICGIMTSKMAPNGIILWQVTAIMKLVVFQQHLLKLLVGCEKQIMCVQLGGLRAGTL